MDWTKEEIEIIRKALPAVEAAANSRQDECWPGDGPAHDDHCHLTDHDLSARAVAATKGLSWEFSSWSSTVRWMREVIRCCASNSPAATT